MHMEMAAADSGIEAMIVVEGSAEKRFLQLSDDFSSWNDSSFVVIPAPLEATVTWGKGTRDGPAAIIEASRHMEAFDFEEETEHVSRGHGICTLKIPSWTADKEGGTGADRLNNALSDIENAVRLSRRAGKIPVILGGEHTVTLAAMNALIKDVEDVFLFVLDAHADLRSEWEGNEISHATVTARIAGDLGVPTILFGVRSASREEWELINSRKLSNLEVITASEFIEHDRERALSRIMRAVRGKKLYISIDLDVLDPSEAPAVGTPEPGGLSFRELTEVLFSATGACHELVGFDVVEAAPIPGLRNTEYLAAALIYRMMGACSFRK